MNKNPVLMISAILLLALAVYMIYLGMKGNLMPPKLTGVGFIIVAVAFLSIKNKEK